jgi:hypothetical protein
MRRARRPLRTLTLCALGVLLGACSAPAPAAAGPDTSIAAEGTVEDRPTLHVAVDGDDSAAGTAEQPLRTIERAAELAEPGTLVRVAAGRYEGAVTTATSGTAGAPVTFRSDPVGAAEVVGTGEDGPAWRNSGDHVEIIGFAITGETLDGLLDEGSFVRIIGNRVSGFRGNCITTARSGYTLHDIDVIGNVVRDCGLTELDHGIYVSHPGGVVANNVSSGNAGFGIHCWHNCNGLLVAHNLVFDNDEGGILIGQGDSPNNGDVEADGFLVANNIALDNGNYGIEESGATGTGNRYLNNNVHGNAAGGLDLQTGSESGTVTDSPGFVDFRLDGSGDYRLLPDSPMIDRGAPEGAVSTDIDGTPRPRGAGVDIGVYER